MQFGRIGLGYVWRRLLGSTGIDILFLGIVSQGS